MKVSGSNNSDFQMPEPGTYVARCIKLVDLGTQSGEYQGKPTARRQVVIEWELPTELIVGGEWDGMPMTVRKFYTRTLFETATLRHDLMNWRGRDFTVEELDDFELENILGAPCMLTLSATDTGRRKITAVSQLMKGATVPKQITPSLVFDLDAFNAATYDGLSDWFKETIAKSPEYQKVSSGCAAAPVGTVDDPADDLDGIPF
jgi:hypothetical protein